MTETEPPRLAIVLPFPGRDARDAPPNEPPAIRLERGFLPGPCDAGYHAAIVDERARRVECSRCKAELDPFVVLNELARHHEWYKHIIAESARLGAEMEALKGEVAKMRGARNALRRKSEKQGERT